VANGPGRLRSDQIGLLGYIRGRTYAWQNLEIWAKVAAEKSSGGPHSAGISAVVGRLARFSRLVRRQWPRAAPRGSAWLGQADRQIKGLRKLGEGRYSRIRVATWLNNGLIRRPGIELVGPRGGAARSFKLQRPAVETRSSKNVKPFPGGPACEVDATVAAPAKSIFQVKGVLDISFAGRRPAARRNSPSQLELLRRSVTHARWLGGGELGRVARQRHPGRN